MSGCLPKPYALGWHIPNFVNGSTPCTLQTFNETKAKSIVGGALFISRAVGEVANNITVEWIVNAGIGSPNVVYDVTLMINGQSYGTLTQTFVPGDPLAVPPTSDSWTGDVVGGFRYIVNTSTSSPVYMPASYNFDFGGVTITYTTDPDHISASTGSVNLSNGTSGPIVPTNIRTGPMLSLIHINQSEKNTTNGVMEVVNQSRYFNGACWKAFDVTSDPCAYMGSPCFGSPQCYGSPLGDCP